MELVDQRCCWRVRWSVVMVVKNGCGVGGGEVLEAVGDGGFRRLFLLLLSEVTLGV